MICITDYIREEDASMDDSTMDDYVQAWLDDVIDADEFYFYTGYEVEDLVPF